MTSTFTPQPQYNPYNDHRAYTGPQQVLNAPQPMINHAIAPMPAAPVQSTVRIDQGKYWVGSVLTATVAALAGIIGIIVATGILHIDMSTTAVGGTAAHMVTFGVLSAVVALFAALAYEGMRAFAPRPTMYFSLLCALLIALAVIWPFTAGVALTAALAMAAINLVVGVLIMVLVPVASTNAQIRS